MGPVGSELDGLGGLGSVLGRLARHVGLGLAFVGCSQDAVVANGGKLLHTVGRIGKQGPVIVEGRFEDLALRVDVGHRAVRCGHHLAATRYRGDQRAVIGSFRHLGVAVGERDGGLAGHRVGLGNHAHRVGYHNGAIGVLPGDIVLAVRCGERGSAGRRVESLHTPVGHVLLDRAVIEG